MPVLPLPFFESFDKEHFHIGGDPGAILGVAYDWLDFGGACEIAVGDLNGLDTSTFLGSEGDRFTELAHTILPGQVRAMGDAHTAVGEAIRTYSDLLTDSHVKMKLIKERARGDHTEVNLAAERYAAAEAAEAAALATGGAALLAAETAKAEALNDYLVGMAEWDHDLAEAALTKYELGLDVQKLTEVILGQAREAFTPNPTGVAGADAAEERIDDLYTDGQSLLEQLSIVTDLVPIIPLKLLSKLQRADADPSQYVDYLNSRKNNKWSDLELALSQYLPPEAMKKLHEEKQKNLSYMPQGPSEIDSRLTDEQLAALARGEQIDIAGEPVDVATGAVVDFAVDVFVDGVLPITITRNCRSDFTIGKTFGPQWVSNLDCRIEVFDDIVLMLTPDGALIHFPTPKVAEEEVRGTGRPWLLSFSDGAYRVRDVAAGIVYVFSTSSSVDGHLPTGLIVDESYEVTRVEHSLVLTESHVEGWGRPSSSVAAQLGIGIEIELSAIAHRSGFWLEYQRDPRSGNIAHIVRSDGTVADLVWDGCNSRLTGVWVRSQGQEQTFDPVARHIGYEHDQAGFLWRVINSREGALSFNYDENGRISGWQDRNDVCFHYAYDEQGRNIAQVGSGGMFANAVVWLDDVASDAPERGRICVMVETAGKFEDDPLKLGAGVIADRLARLEALPLVQALRSGGLKTAGLVGWGRDGQRPKPDAPVEMPSVGTMPQEWLHDDVLGDIRPTVYRSTPQGDVWRIVDPAGVATDYAHNNYHQLIGVLNAREGVSQLVRDEYGQVIGQGFPDGSHVKVQTGAWGRPTKVISSNGFIMEYELDAAGNILSITDPTGRTSKCEYQWRATGVVPWKLTDADGRVATIECNAAGLVLAREEASGARWSWVRNPLGQVIETMDPFGAVTKIDYSPQGWLNSIILPDGTKQELTYDGEGNVIRHINELGEVTDFTYTVFDKLIEVSDPAGGKTQYEYNTQMEVTGVINADGNRWDYQRDLNGEVASESDYNGLITHYRRDPIRGMTQVIDPAGGINTAWYDFIGRVEHTVDSAGRETHYSYAPQGQLESIINPETKLSYKWDEYGRLQAEYMQLASGELTSVVAERDACGRTCATTMTVAGHITRQEYGYNPHTGYIEGVKV